MENNQEPVQENYEELEVPTYDYVPFEEPIEAKSLEHSEHSEFNFDEYIKKELGLPEGKFYTGSADSPIEKSVSELSMKQKVALLKHGIQSRSLPKQEVVQDDYNEDEKLVISLLREGKLKELYDELGQELEVGSPAINLDSEEIAIWNLSNQYPNMTEEELREELEQMKELPSWEKKQESFVRNYQQAQQYQKQQEEQYQNELLAEQARELEQRVAETIKSTNSIGEMFELDDSDVDVKRSAFEYIQNKSLLEYLETPEGLAKTAIMYAALPKMEAYIKELHDKIDELNQDKPRTVVTTGTKEKVANGFEDLDKFVRDI